MSLSKAAKKLGDEGACSLNADRYMSAQRGLTKRELLAAMAMQSLCGDFARPMQSCSTKVADQAVCYTDALLERLTKETSDGD